MLWTIALGEVLLLGVFPGVPALTQDVLDAFLGDLDLEGKRDVSTYSKQMTTRKFGIRE